MNFDKHSIGFGKAVATNNNYNKKYNRKKEKDVSNKTSIKH